MVFWRERRPVGKSHRHRDLWIFLLHFPLANLCLCILFARTARGPDPIVARLALIVAGIGVSAWWVRSALRRIGLGFRFAPT